jgi:hypothetical protein
MAQCLTGFHFVYLLIVESNIWERVLLHEGEKLHEFIHRFILLLSLNSDLSEIRVQEKRVLAHTLLQSYDRLSQVEKQSIIDSPAFIVLWNATLECIRSRATSAFDGESAHSLLLLQMYRLSKYDFDILNVLEFWAAELSDNNNYELIYCQIVNGLDVFIDLAKRRSYNGTEAITRFHDNFDSLCNQLETNKFDMQAVLAKLERLRGLIKVFNE